MTKNINGIIHQLCYCKQCGAEKWKRKSLLKSSPNTFCSRDCLNQFKRTGSTISCSFCGKRFYRAKSGSRGADTFCSRSCSNSANNSRYKSEANHPNWKGGFSTYRERALKFYGPVCSSSECPFKESEIPVKMLDVDHVDNDRTNNSIQNLQILCVWCHALKTRVS